MSDGANCTSCGMSIESGPYCRHCSDDAGQLIPFEECFERMMQWTMRKDPSRSRDDAERDTLRYMRTMPAWEDHPRVLAAEE